MFPIAVAVSGVGVDLSGPWGRAMTKTGMKRDVLACLMRYQTASQLSHAVAGREHLSLQRLLLLLRDPDGRRFLHALAQEVLEAEGLDLEAIYDIARIQYLAARLVDRVQKRVFVKADLDHEERKRA